MSPLSSFILSKLFTADTSTFFEDGTFKKRQRTHQRFVPQSHLNHRLLLESETLGLFALILLLLAASPSTMPLCIHEIKTDTRGYALPVWNAVHMCIFRRKTFFRGKNVLFFIRDYLKFFTVMEVGSI